MQLPPLTKKRWLGPTDGTMSCSRRAIERKRRRTKENDEDELDRTREAEELAKRARHEGDFRRNQPVSYPGTCCHSAHCARMSPCKHGFLPVLQ